MRRRRVTADYIALCARVGALDPAAARYLRDDAPALRGFVGVGDLAACFSWVRTPQGWGYWRALHCQLSKLRS